jgi:predicted transcriptional regulator
MDATITEAAEHLGVTERTVRRRLHNGELRGRQITTPQGFTWIVELPDSTPYDNVSDHVSDQVEEPNYQAILKELEGMKQLVMVLTNQVDIKDRQIEQLHVLLQQSQTALPSMTTSRPWWKFW